MPFIVADRRPTLCMMGGMCVDCIWGDFRWPLKQTTVSCIVGLLAVVLLC